MRFHYHSVDPVLELEPRLVYLLSTLPSSACHLCTVSCRHISRKVCHRLRTRKLHIQGNSLR